MTKRAVMGLVAAGVVMSGAAAWAATATGEMAVSANVENSCTVSAADLAFGLVTFDNNVTVVNNKSALVTVTCAVTETVDVTFGLGDNADNNQRRMKAAGNNFLNYDLYTDDGGTGPIGATTDVEVAGADSGGVGVTIYGQVPAGQAVGELGDYTDMVVVTVTYTGTET